MKKVVFIKYSRETDFSVFASKNREMIYLNLIEKNLLEKGQEGFRQIVNYFGESYLKKTGDLNLVKFYAFLNTSEKIMRIYFFMLMPILKNKLEQLIRKSNSEMVIIFGDYIEQKSIEGIADFVINLKINAAVDFRQEALGKFDNFDLEITENGWENELKLCLDSIEQRGKI